MASSIRSRRTAIAAGALSLALVAPLTSPVVAEHVLPFAVAATTASTFDDRYSTGNFWNTNEAEIEGLKLEAGDRIVARAGLIEDKSIFAWGFRNDNGTLILIRPKSDTAYKTGDVDIAVKVTPADGKAFNTTLKVNVVDEEVPEDPNVTSEKTFNQRYKVEGLRDNKEAVVQDLKLNDGDKVERTTDTIFNYNFRVDNGTLTIIRPQSDTAFRTGEQSIPVKVTPAGKRSFTTNLLVNIVDPEPTTSTTAPVTPTTSTTPASTTTSAAPAEPSTSTSAPTTTSTTPAAPQGTTAGSFNERFTTDNFWQKQQAAIQGLTLNAGDKVEPTTKTIFNWNFSNDNGTLILKRPQSASAFKSGSVDIPVRVTSAGGQAFTTTLKVTVVDEPDLSWVETLEGFDTRHNVSFKEGTTQDVPGTKVPAGAVVEKDGFGQVGWTVKNENGTLRVTAPATFTGEKPADQDIPVNIRFDGSTEKRTLKLSATPAESRAPEITQGIGGLLGSILGPIVGALLGGGSGGGGGLKLGPLVEIHDNPVRVEVKDNIRDNTATADVRDNIRDNVRDNTADVHDNVKDNVKENVKDNVRDNKAEAEVHDNFKDNIKENAKDNGNNNSATADVEIHDNIKENVKDNKAEAEIRDNVRDNVRDNAAKVDVPVNVPVNVPIEGKVDVLPNGLGGSSNKSGGNGGNGGNAGGGSNGSSGPGVTNNGSSVNGSSQGGGINDPRCIASLVGIGLPLVALVPVVLANVFRIPGFEGIQDALKQAAAAAPGLNITPEQAAAGLGGFAGAVVIASIFGAVTACTPQGDAAPQNPEAPASEKKEEPAEK